MNTHRLLLVALLASFTFATAATVSAQRVRWEHNFGGDFTDAAFSVLQTSDGGYITAGLGEVVDPSGIARATHGYLVKFDRDGLYSWDRHIDAATTLLSIIPWKGGGYVVAGYLPDTVFVAAVDSVGTVLWQHIEPRAGVTITQAIATHDGGFAVTGYIEPIEGAQQYGIVLYKFDSTGALAWTKTAASNNFLEGDGIVQTADDGYAITGTGSVPGRDHNDAILYRLDAHGDSLFLVDLPTDRYAGGSAIVAADGGGYIIGGFAIDRKEGGATGPGGIFLTRTSDRGNVIWTSYYRDSTITGSTNFNGMTRMADGGYAIVGAIGNGYYPFAMHINADGDRLWDTTYRSNVQIRSLYSVVATSDGNIVAAGSIRSEGVARNVLVMKIGTSLSGVTKDDALPNRLFLY